MKSIALCIHRALTLRLLLITCLVCLAISSFAAPATTPETLITQMSDQMIAGLKANQNALKAKPNIITGLVNRILVPHIDADRMAGSVVGRSYWASATPAQKEAFINSFKQLVTNTYAAALASYDDDQVKVYPIRGGVQGNTTQVQSSIIRKSGQQIGISYNLVLNNGQWQVYDFSIEGVSLVQNYKSQFESPLAQGGLAGLITQLQEYNRTHPI